MSTDTAFALGLLALVGPRFPDRLRAFMLTVVVVDDIVALVVIATVYSDVDQLGSARSSPSVFYGGILVLRSTRLPGRLRLLRPRRGRLGRAAQVGRRTSRHRPRDGILPYAYSGGALDLERATRAVPRVPRAADAGARALRGGAARAATPPNERLQQLYHPWTSYVIVPLFALANAGIAIDGAFVARAFTSPITLGILFGYVARQAARDPRRLVARDAAQPRPAAASGRLGDRRRRWHDCRRSDSPSRC